MPSVKHIAANRLISQQITSTKHKTVKDIVAWMSAMQAQDNEMAKWAVGLRLPAATHALITTAIDKGEIIRTHVMRPTWHLVSADDVYWMLQLSAPHILTSLRSRHKELELTEAVFAKSNTCIEKMLAPGKHLTREELVKGLEKAKIATISNRSAHLLLRAELDCLICSGKTVNNKQTYALLETRVPKPKSLPREEALAKIASRYFTSHGPATLEDFVWWSGLPVKDARNTIEMVKKNLVCVKHDEKNYWTSPQTQKEETGASAIYLLPAFDEFIISYRDRTASLASVHNPKAISNNGIFWPVIVNNGQVIGLWKRTIKKDTVEIGAELFKPVNAAIRKQIAVKAEQFGNFLQKKVKLIYI